MTTEQDFHAKLDADPSDWQTRLVFADWLDDQGDVRAEGYRALARGRHRTDTTSGGGVISAFHWWDRTFTDRVYADYPHIFHPCSLASDWFELLNGRPEGTHRRDFDTRRAAENGAARAFAKLPPERRAALLVERGAP